MCPENCWNEPAGMCEKCAPDEREAAGKRAAQLRVERAQNAATADAPIALVTCPGCGVQARGGKFCEACGASFTATLCKHCKKPMNPSARFCGECGGTQT
jgi:Double zinc ribbon